MINITETPTTIKCPVTHPYVFNKGRDCCKTNVEGTDGGIEGVTCDGFFRHPHCDSTCDGLELSIYSNCCENGAFYPCDDGNLCINGNTNKGIFSGDIVVPDILYLMIEYTRN